MRSHVQQPLGGCRASACSTDPPRNVLLHVKSLHSSSQWIADSRLLRLLRSGKFRSTAPHQLLGIRGGWPSKDMPKSSCIESDINNIYILTQSNSTRLKQHLAGSHGGGLGDLSGGDGCVDGVAATETRDDQGTANAVQQPSVLDDAKDRIVQDIVILSGDQALDLSGMNFMKFLNRHQSTQADITIGCRPVDQVTARFFNLLKVDAEGRALVFGKRQHAVDMSTRRDVMWMDTTVLGLDAEEAAEKPFLASAGVYMFKKDVLLKLLSDMGDSNFASQVIPAAAKAHEIQSYVFNDMEEDVGSPSEAFPDLRGFETHTPHNLASAKFANCEVSDSIVADGAILYNSTLKHAYVGLRARLESGTKITSAVVSGSDCFESQATREALVAQGHVPLGIGTNTIIENAFIGMNARIGTDCVPVNKEGIREADRPDKGYYIRSGILCIMSNATIPNGTQI